MKRFLTLTASLLLTLGMLLPGIAHAQSGPTDVGVGIQPGTAIPYFDNDGVQIGTITVENIVDPFDGYDSNSSPQRGYHYALVEITITNTGTRPFDVNPWDFVGIDSDGFPVDSGYVSFTDPSIVSLDSVDALGPGETVRGARVFSLFSGATLENLVYTPTSERTIFVLDLRTTPVTLGTSVSLIDSDGGPLADVTVNDVIDPFSDYSSSSAPPRGSRYVALDVTITNTGVKTLETGPYDIQLIDSEGFVADTAYVTRSDTTVPDLGYMDLAPGETANGIMIYSIYQDTQPTKVIFANISVAIVADLDTGEAIPFTPPVSSTAIPTEPTAVVSSDGAIACVGLVEWGTDLAQRLDIVSTLGMQMQTMSNPTPDDVGTVQDIANQFRTMGDEQASSNPPPAAVELNTFMVEQFYYPLADVIDQLATALEQNNGPAALSAQMALGNIMALFQDDSEFDQMLATLAITCPAEISELNQ